VQPCIMHRDLLRYEHHQMGPVHKIQGMQLSSERHSYEDIARKVMKHIPRDFELVLCM
jgi:hypothetical protein